MNQPALFRGVYPSLQHVKASARLTPQALAQAEQVYVQAYASRCPHAPPCGLRSTCVRQIAQAMRSKGYV